MLLFDSSIEEVSLIVSASMIGCCTMTLMHSNIRSYVADGSSLVFGNFWRISAAVAISRCYYWVVVTADKVQVAGDGFIGLEVHLVGPLLRRGGFKINRDASSGAIRALRRNPCLFNFAGAKAMNLSSIEVQGDNKQVVKLLCVTEAEPSCLGMCFHCFQIFVLWVWRYLFHFPCVLGRQTRRPTGLQNPLTRINHLSHGFLALFGYFSYLYVDVPSWHFMANITTIA
ncbi:hypothetical protein RHMOL_Rhmol11G0221200 [Rhododendron molle]|uniref:Uncharacterized protein n=1 Tax=Rhododendron molle TaxID=49168 RepID=A0ACC0LVB5_RHOML|nr:hypothetical protein RHMOL_Rhmol11G0221200 [Rhododendron molle]